jgi:hypothetical protein
MTSTGAFDFSALLSATQDVDHNHNDDADDATTAEEKMQLLQFLRVLMTTLRQERPMLYNQTMLVLEDCAMKARTGSPGFETYQSAQRTMLARLKHTVGQDYWNQSMVVSHNK